MQIPLINEHLFYKYFVRLSVGNATKGFATYGCCHPCFITKDKFNILALCKTTLINTDNKMITTMANLIIVQFST